MHNFDQNMLKKPWITWEKLPITEAEKNQYSNNILQINRGKPVENSWKKSNQTNNRDKKQKMPAKTGKLYLVGRQGLEPRTSSTSRTRSSQLSYRPTFTQLELSAHEVILADMALQSKLCYNLTMQTLKVFCTHKGEFGDSTGFIVDEKQEFYAKKRQKIAKDSGFDEIAFVDDVARGKISIYNPIKEIAFAGQIVVGAAWFWRNILLKPLDQIICRDFTVEVGSDKNSAWAIAPINNMPPWDIVYEEDSEKMEQMNPPEVEHTMIWSWQNRAKGVVQARTFAPDWGIPEAEVNGSGSILLAEQLGRKLIVNHGAGSIIGVEPLSDDFCRLSGYVVKS